MSTRPMPREHNAPVTQWWNKPTAAERAYEHAVARQQASGDDFDALMARRYAEDEAELEALKRRRERAAAERGMARMNGAFAWLLGSCIGGALVVAVNFIIFGGINP